MIAADSISAISTNLTASKIIRTKKFDVVPLECQQAKSVTKNQSAKNSSNKIQCTACEGIPQSAATLPTKRSPLRPLLPTKGLSRPSRICGRGTISRRRSSRSPSANNPNTSIEHLDPSHPTPQIHPPNTNPKSTHTTTAPRDEAALIKDRQLRYIA